MGKITVGHSNIVGISYDVMTYQNENDIIFTQTRTRSFVQLSLRDLP